MECDWHPKGFHCSNYEEAVRLTKRNGQRYVDLYVYIYKIQGEGAQLKNALNQRRQQYEGGAPGQTECVWNEEPAGADSQSVVHYYVPFDWEHWATAQEEQKNNIANAFLALHNAANDLDQFKGALGNHAAAIWNNQVHVPGGDVADGVPAGVQDDNDDDVADDEGADHSTAKNVILYGPPGTGKTYNTVLRAVEIIDGSEMVNGEDYADIKPIYDGYKAQGRIKAVTFHQAYGYEEFIGGIRPKTDANGNISYPVRPGVFTEFCKTAQDHPEDKYVFIIDEINRGNVAKVFGELITLLEESKRIGEIEETRIAIPGFEEDPEGEPGKFDFERNFGVPSNVYVLGTMNTADRSLAKLDVALRRRFDFDELMPDSNLLPVDVAGVNLQRMLKAMNDRIMFLVDREHQIGHAWLMNVSSLHDLASAFKRKIIPLLQEYFYDDYAKIRKVVNDDIKGSRTDLVFIGKKTPEAGLFAEDDDVERYELNDDAFQSPLAYRSIYDVTVLQAHQPVPQPGQQPPAPQHPVQ